MTLRHPGYVERLLTKNAQLARWLIDEYRWGYNALLSGRSVSMGAEPLRRGAMDPDLDPTGDTAVNKDEMRARAEEFIEQLEASCRQLDAAAQKLASAIPFNRRGRPKEKPHDSALSEEEFAEGYDAQARRESRGEGWGEG